MHLSGRVVDAILQLPDFSNAKPGFLNLGRGLSKKKKKIKISAKDT